MFMAGTAGGAGPHGLRVYRALRRVMPCCAVAAAIASLLPSGQLLLQSLVGNPLSPLPAAVARSRSATTAAAAAMFKWHPDALAWLSLTVA